MDNEPPRSLFSSEWKGRKLVCRGEEGVLAHCRFFDSRVETISATILHGLDNSRRGARNARIVASPSREHEGERDSAKEVETADVVTHLRLNSGRRGCKLFIEPATMLAR